MLVHPPLSPISGHKSFSRKGCQGVYFEARAAGILYARLFHTPPPTPRRVFAGVGGGGVCIWPRIVLLFQYKAL